MTVYHIDVNPSNDSMIHILCTGEIYRLGEGTGYNFLCLDILKPLALDDELCSDCLNHPKYGMHLLALTDLE